MSSPMKDARWALADKILHELGVEELADLGDYAKRTEALTGAQHFLNIIPEEKIQELADEYNQDGDLTYWSGPDPEGEQDAEDNG